MTDREKVLKALKCCADGCLGDCPYYNVGDCSQLLSKEALELLKEQEERIKKFELERSWDENPDRMGNW